MTVKAKSVPVTEEFENEENSFTPRKKKTRLIIAGILLLVVASTAIGLSVGLTRKENIESLQHKRRSDGKTAPYGSWKSPLSSKVVSSSSISFHDLRVDPRNPGTIYWTELHPDEGGINVLYSFKIKDQQLTRWTASSVSLSSRVHEYGGAAFIVYNGVVYFVNHSDQKLYMMNAPLQNPVAITKTDDMRYGDCAFHATANKLICVREDHSVVKSGTNKEAQNTIVMIDLASQTETVLVKGSDFYASPKISPNGKELVWMQWSHPNMPWDDTQIYKGSFDDQVTSLMQSSIKKVEGRAGLNVMHPRWSPDGTVLYISDETNWWNIYEEGKNLYKVDTDLGQPQWRLGCDLFSVSNNGNIVFINDRKPAIIYKNSGKVENLPSKGYHPKTVLFSPDGKSVYLFGDSPIAHSAILSVELASGNVEILKNASNSLIDEAYLSKPEKITFPTGKDNKSKAYGYLYMPENKDYSAPKGALPPLLIQVHGGPTAAASLALDYNIQYYTSRGFAVLDVDYRGSTGYGRKFRTSLYGNWGVYDMEDCAKGASYLAHEKKIVDPKKLVISGGSAGGYVVLASLTFTDVFAAGSSHYGISDIVVLIKETHKFESRYIDNLLLPGDKGLKLARERSPIYHLDSLKKPIAFFQGELDKVVPPNQAHKMFDAIKAKGLPCAFVLFKGEYHGFAKSESKQKALDGEFYFFSKLLDFEAADKGIEIKIENLKQK
ncbi:uncharacterized peptidase YuxL-like [Rhopilema esculentum]|uniref:uncharacterized peptidase YuxL-like n=1 Tax=Rhopilema esculentum TaxID=499914 RepID=UPI0031E23B19